MPSGAKILPLRSNIPKISEHCFVRCDPDFPARCKKEGKGIIIGGENYGQGSSREHAALAPLYLGVKAVVVKSFARIHKANLVNSGILPLTFVNPGDYDKITEGDQLALKGLREAVAGKQPIVLRNLTTGDEYQLACELSDRAREIILAGGLLRYTKAQHNG